MIQKLKSEYSLIRDDIESRLKEFEDLWKRGSDKDIFYELMFCLMTPQSKAELCWEAVERIKTNDILSAKIPEDIIPEMSGVRFKYKKSTYILEAKVKFLLNDEFSIKNHITGFKNIFDLREWIVANIKGIGYKEAGHFLRNIGFGKEIAILDRHILKNLKKYNVIESVPQSITKNNYFKIENKMRIFAEKISIPLSHLDLLFWYKEAGTIFK